MKAKITVKSYGNRSTIIVKREMAVRFIPAATTDVDRIVRLLVIQLSNAGYEVY